jgi:hypothetical protein
MVPKCLLKAALESICEYWRRLGVNLTHLEHKIVASGPAMLIFHCFVGEFSASASKSTRMTT